MTIRRLERNQWVAFCTHASHGLLGKQVEIEIMSLQTGSQLGARQQPLLGMAYDTRNDIFELLVGGGLDHFIRSPREIYIDEEWLGIVRLQIEDADGVRQIVTLRDPLMLPAPYA